MINILSLLDLVVNHRYLFSVEAKIEKLQEVINSPSRKFSATDSSLSKIPGFGFHLQLEQVYHVRINNRERIKTTVTKYTSNVDKWINQFYSDYKQVIKSRNSIEENSIERFMVGLDIRPVAFGGEHDSTVIGTIQVCLGHRCLIFMIQRADKVPDSLKEFLSDINLRFVARGSEVIAAKLNTEYQISVEKAVDVVELMSEKAYDKDIKEYFKSLILCPSDNTVLKWDLDYLTGDQVRSACVEAYAAFKIGDHFRFTGISSKKSSSVLD